MGNQLKETLKNFKIYCMNNRISRVLIKGIPYLGDSIDELIYGEETEQILLALEKITQEQEEEIIPKLYSIMKSTNNTHDQDTIIAIGGGNAEYVYTVDEIKMGQKNIVNNSIELIGGGAVNFASRLLATGHEVFPIIALGNDRPGKKIRDALVEFANCTSMNPRLINFLSTEDAFVPGMKTSAATILVQKTGRTTLSNINQGNEDEVKEFISKRIQNIKSIIGGNPSMVRVSHINQFCNSQNPDFPGSIIKMIIEKFTGRSIIMVNLGSSQINLGIKYWEQSLQNVDIIQLNLHEAKQLFMIDNSNEPPKLTTIIKWFQERKITAIITLSKFGAIGTYKNGNEGIVFAWPIETKSVDPTGAGDAYSAGIASILYNKPSFQFPDFFSAVDVGRYWASYACKTLGGCGSCPSSQELDNFINSVGDHDPTEVINQKYSEQSLKLIDKAYSE